MNFSFIEINGEKFIKTSNSLTHFDEIISITPVCLSVPPYIHIDCTFEGLKGNPSSIELECTKENCSEMVDIFMAEYKKTLKKKSHFMTKLIN